MTGVAIVACRAGGAGAGGAVHPDPDWPCLEAALRDAGVAASLVVWDDDDVDWAGFDAAVIRSTWDSVDRPDAYLAWVSATAPATRLLNPLEAIAWNMDKRYLRTLAASGVPVVPTLWVDDRRRWMPPPGEYVVKPSVSGGGRETARYGPGDSTEAGVHAGRILDQGKAVMVQRYVPSVDDEGETKLVFVGGVFSHAVRVGPQLAAGAGVRERPWEIPVPINAADPSQAQLDAARRVLAAVDDELRAPLLYARVDLVTGVHGAPLLAEVELVDPSLFLRCAPAAAGRLAAAIAAATGPTGR